MNRVAMMIIRFFLIFLTRPLQMKSVICVTTAQADRNVSSGRALLIPSHTDEDNPTFLLTAALWFGGAEENINIKKKR